MGNRHVVDGSLDFGQRKDVFHQLDNLCPGKLLDLRGYALNRAAQIAKAVGALLALALFQMLMQNEAWLDEINRIVSFHEISDSRYYSAEEHDFWQTIVSLIMTGYRVQ